MKYVTSDKLRPPPTRYDSNIAANITIRIRRDFRLRSRRT